MRLALQRRRQAALVEFVYAGEGLAYIAINGRVLLGIDEGLLVIEVA